MGREIKRVPLDFNQPLKEIWSGYLMPIELNLPNCLECDGRGSTLAYQWLGAITTLLMMTGEASVSDRPLHPYLQNIPNSPSDRPSADMFELTRGLAERGDPRWGHDSSDMWRARNKIIAAAELSESWGHCPRCNGNGHVATAEQLAAHEAWEPTEPPTGAGWQLWEDTTEGSPVSPVFAEAEDLAQWMSRNRCGFGGSIPSLGSARAMVKHEGWTPSMVFSMETGPVDGITFEGVKHDA